MSDANLDAADLHAIDEAQAEWRLMRWRAEVRRRDPGCGACANYEPSGYDAGHGACTEPLAWAGRSECVPARGWVPCGYDDFEPADAGGWEERDGRDERD